MLIFTLDFIPRSESERGSILIKNSWGDGIHWTKRNSQSSAASIFIDFYVFTQTIFIFIHSFPYFFLDFHLILIAILVVNRKVLAGSDNQ